MREALGGLMEIERYAWDERGALTLRGRLLGPSGTVYHAIRTRMESLGFTPDGSRLAAAVFRQSAAYVWDLTAEINFCHGRVGVFAGINNLFNEDFYAEIRDEGIVPAYLRNYYAGFSLKF